MTEKGTKLHDLLAERITECVNIADQLCVSDPARILIEAKADLRKALAAVRDRAAALRVFGTPAPRPREHRPAPSEVLQEIHARRIRFGRPRKRGLLGLLGGL